MFDLASLIISGFFGLIGMAFFVYGKRQSEMNFLVAGIVLSLYPFFVTGATMISVIGVALTAAPFVMNRYSE